MWLRLRQIAGVAETLQPVEDDIVNILGVEVCYRDPAVGRYGLENALIPIGNQLLEVVAPIQENTAGGRYLARRGGDGGYMVITQCDHHPPRRSRVDELGIRIVLDRESDEYIIMQLHPADTGGSFFEIDQQLGAGALEPDGPWHPAGPNWQRAKKTQRVSGITAAEMQCDDPEAVANRWGEIAQVDIDYSGGIYRMAMENAELRFVAITDGRPEGLSAIDVTAVDKDAILAEAERRQKISADNQVTLCGIRMNLI